MVELFHDHGLVRAKISIAGTEAFVRFNARNKMQYNAMQYK
jgi:hypothetical protein